MIGLGGCHQAQVAVVGPEESLEVVRGGLVGTGRVSGVVAFMHDGKPVPDFRACLRYVRTNGDLLGTPRDGVHIQFAGGTFHFDGIVEMECVVEVTAAGYVPARSEVFFVDSGDERANLRIALGHGGTISGRLVDNQTGEPVAGALVQTVDNSSWDFFTTREALEAIPRTTTAAQTHTDENGDYALGRLSNATYSLQFDHPDYPRELAKDIRVAGEELTQVSTVRLPHGATVEGIVVGHDGEPLANARITMAGDPPYPHEVRTDAKGRYTLMNIHAGTYKLSAMRSASGHPEGPFGALLDMKKSRVPMSFKPDEKRIQDLSLAD